MTEEEKKAEKYLMEVVKPQRIEVTVLTANREIKKAFVAGYREGKKMTDKEIQASDEEMEQFNVSQNEKCVSGNKEKLNDLMNKISISLKDANLQQGVEIICKRIAELEKENEELKKNVLVWHKVTCFDKPDENGYITASNPADEGKDYLVLLKNKNIVISTLAYNDAGFFFEDFYWEDIEAWAELPKVEI